MNESLSSSTALPKVPVDIVETTYAILREQLQRAPVRRLALGHSSIAYRRIGSGPDLVFVHGWPLDSNTFRAVAPRLANDFTCHLLDLPGAGASVCHDRERLRLASFAATVREVVDQLGLRRYALLAHDSGGYAARVLAADDERVSALVLGNTELPNHTPSLIRLLKLVLALPFGRGLLRGALQLRAVRRSALGFGGCFRDLRLIDGEFHQLFVAPFLRSATRAQDTLEVLATLEHALVQALPAIHARIRVPSLLIWGGDDPLFPLAGARAMLSQLAGGAELEIIEGGKAFVHEEEPARFAEHARDFLRRVHGDECAAAS
jgi:haloalkane dehalogenase